MTRSKATTSTVEKTSSNSNSNLQPTKITSRSKRGENVALKADLKPQVSVPRDVFHPSNLYPDEYQGSGDNENAAQFHFTHSKTEPAPHKVGLGPVIFNLKPHHYYSSKKPCEPKVSMGYYKKKYPHIFNKTDENVPVVKRNADDAALRLCKSMKALSIFREDEEKENKEKVENNGRQLHVKKGKHLMQQSFKKLVAQRVAYESGQKITVLIDELKTKEFKKSSGEVRKAGVRNWRSPGGSENMHNGLLRDLFSWSLATSSKWKDNEARVVSWRAVSKEGGKTVSIKEVADLLNMTVEEVSRLEFLKDFKKIVNALKDNICHSSLPWLTTLAAVSELQKGNIVCATRSATEGQGTFLHCEIIDKHICYISRNEDFHSTSSQRSSFSTKAELFRKQIRDTISFGRDTESTKSAFSEIISTFDPDWNIVQITALLHSKNRFGTDLCGKRRIPQLLLSALAHIPNENDRCIFTTFCYDPPVEEGSLMSCGIMEEFQRILDRNLVISDDSVVISKRNYWEERTKHNQAMKSVIVAMEEEWIGPWNFLLPGHTKHREIREKVRTKIINPSAKKYRLSSSQKLVLYKLTENYRYLHPTISSALETVISFILQVPETGLSTLCKKICDIGNEVPLDNRHPTVLVVDQDMEIFPWESMSCLVNTDVTRMPSLNLIRSNYNFVTSLRPSYPDIVDSNSCTVVLNPDGTLPNVQKRLEQYFLDHKQWLPVIGRPPQTKEVQECLENQHIFLYNGHGAGSNFYPDFAVQKLVCRAVPLLMGCASAQAYYAVPRVYGSSTIHSYFLAGCPSVVGYLWEVTDAECDRITVDLIERWLPDKNIRPPKILFFDQDAVREPEKCLPTAMRKSRKAATQFLTGCAIVCYGLPISTQN